MKSGTYTMFPVNVSIQTCITPFGKVPASEDWKWVGTSRDGKYSFWAVADLSASENVRDWDYTSVIREVPK